MTDQHHGTPAGPDRWGEQTPERLYVITGSRAASHDRTSIDLVSLVVARVGPDPMTPPEQAAILRLCETPLSVAEISAYLRLPVRVVTLLLTDLLTDGSVQVRGPVPVAVLPDRELIEAVIHGLQRL
ncbi:DUF742 domain-containing protein [Streptomyces tateyamensis]|uniref:DUF742 domain-containing protein n=1 Tax=Streptomyces tateyamensis TaxID=565073 RepID=A0A2V4NPF4_9ACTN|nr:DUF742 domain-containing protein [Streptomyces tateyamensis]PYC87453.1 DUF742 domain-containing protein [Streptomyces tateyamensis]